MKLQKLYSKVRQALDDYNMITENDKIAIGVSGGKDSLTLLYALSGIRSFYPVPFELVAIAVDLGYAVKNDNSTKDINEIIREADSRMYEKKRSMKHRKA